MSRLISNFLRKAPELARITPVFVNKPNLVKLYSTATNKPFVQQPAPDFKGTAVVGSSFKELQLSSFKGKYLILLFYPLDFTFVCPTELIAFSEKYQKFEDLNCEVVGVSIDSHYTHLGWISTPRKEGGLGEIEFPLLSDLKKEISRSYGVLLEDQGIALRGLFIIDPNGIIRHMSVNDLPIGRSVDEALRLVEALKFVEEHGEVCPANWKKGDKTIKPDPVGSKEYFKTLE